MQAGNAKRRGFDLSTLAHSYQRRNAEALAVQPADARYSFIRWSAGIDSWSQQSYADATTTSEAIRSQFQS